MPLPRPAPVFRRLRWWLLPLALLAVLGLWYLATQQWAIGRRAVAVADGTVRQWAAREVERLSDGGYQLTSSTILVDEARRRIAIDTLILSTDTARNARRAMPLPYVALRLLGCGLEGVDLDRLTAGRGLHVQHFGCDSVSLLVDVPRELSRLTRSSPSGDNRSFLNFRQRLDLPRTLPIILIDSIAFPRLGLVLSIAGATGHRTNITFDRLGMALDSLRYDRTPRETGDRVLLSRDVRITLEHFAGSQEATSHVGLRHLDISLARGTLRLDSLAWRPLPGAITDSLGLTALEVGRLALDDVDWFEFLTAGNVRVGRFELEQALVRLPQRAPTTDPAADVDATPSLAARLRALDRGLQLDTLVARGLAFVQEGATLKDSTGIQVADVQVFGLAAPNTDSAWRSPHPVGHARAVVRGLVQRGAGERLLLDSLVADVADGSLDAFGLRQGPEGDDQAFFRRNRYRRDRIAVAASRISFSGLDLDTWLREGHPRAQRLAIEGLALDVLSDKRKPPAPGRPRTHRTPQQWLADLPSPVILDTITVAGAITYRERAANATAPGVLQFRDLRATITGFAPPGLPGDSLIRLVAESRLMGAGRLHFTLELPREAPDFRMRYRGSLGRMPASALNPFMDLATGMRFDEGTIESIQFDATVTNGRARGHVAPRWRDLKVKLPGIARQGGFLGGLRRAVAGLAANTFVIRRDNHSSPNLRDGVIDYRWQPTETLPSLLWVSLREALLPVLKR